MFKTIRCLKVAFFTLLIVMCFATFASGGQTAKQYMDLAYQYFRQGQLYKAANEFSKALDIQPKNIHALNDRGVCYLHLNQYKKAIADLSKAIEMTPNDDEYVYVSYLNRVSAYYGNKQYKQALSDFNVAHKLTPEWNQAYSGIFFMKAQIYEDTARYKEAINNYELFLKQTQKGFLLSKKPEKKELEHIEKRNADIQRRIASLKEKLKSE